MAESKTVFSQVTLSKGRARALFMDHSTHEKGSQANLPNRVEGKLLTP